MKQPKLPPFSKEEVRDILAKERARKYKYEMALVMPVLDSHEVLRRQIIYWTKHVFIDKRLRRLCQIVIADDMSEPPLEQVFEECSHMINFDYVVFRTESEIPWSQMLGQNMGVEHAESRYVLMSAVDHIIPRWAFDAVADFRYDKMQFPRAWAVLDERGDLRTESEILMQYGAKPGDEYRKAAVQDIYAIKRWIYLEIGGYNPRHIGHYFGDTEFHWEYAFLLRRMGGALARHRNGPLIYCFPGSIDNSLGLFHQMPRKGGHIKKLTEQIHAGRARKGGYRRAVAA